VNPVRAALLAGVALLLVLRDRVALFFIVALPLLIATAIGLAAYDAGGTGVLSLGVVDEDRRPIGGDVLAALGRAPGIALRSYETAEPLRKAVRRGHVDGGIVVPAGLDAAVRAGRPAELVLVIDPTKQAQRGLRAAVDAVLQEQAARVGAATFASSATGASFEEAYARARHSDLARTIEVRASSVTATGSAPRGYDYPIAANLVLFVFITSMAGSADLIEMRRTGVARRLLALPIGGGTILGGIALGRLAIALFQALVILVAGRVVFGVDLGDPLGVGALVLAVALAATGAAMLLGTLFRTADQASSIAPPVGIALGMLGGTMWPLEIVPSAMRTVGHLTPHAWAMDAFLELMTTDAGLADIAPQLLVLLATSALLLGFATVRLRATLSRP
jgi:ABC-2 type transport system permease protein